MNFFNTINSKRNQIITFILILISIVFLFIFLNLKISQNIQTYLEVNQDKKMTIYLNNSNLSLISNKKEIVIKIENDFFNIKEAELINIGNERFLISIQDDEIYDLVKTNSVYRIYIIIDSKKMYQYIFNI